MPTLDVAGTDRHDLLIQQRRGRTMGAAVLLGQCDAALGEVEHHPGGHVVEVDESRLRGQHAPPGGVHREAGVDVTRPIHRRQRRREGVGPDGQVGGVDPSADDAAGQHVETRCHPGDHLRVSRAGAAG